MASSEELMMDALPLMQQLGRGTPGFHPLARVLQNAFFEESPLFFDLVHKRRRSHLTVVHMARLFLALLRNLDNQDMVHLVVAPTHDVKQGLAQCVPVVHVLFEFWDNQGLLRPVLVKIARLGKVCMYSYHSQMYC